MKTWREQLAAGGETSVDVKIQRGTFQGDALLPFLFVLAMMPLDLILWKCARSYKFTKSQEKINHLMYMDNIKLFARN